MRSVQNTLYFFRNPSTTPLRPPAHNLGVAIPQPPGLTPLVALIVLDGGQGSKLPGEDALTE